MTPDLAAVVAARTELDRVLARIDRVPAGVADAAHAQYADACARAGLRTPPPLAVLVAEQAHARRWWPR